MVNNIRMIALSAGALGLMKMIEAQRAGSGQSLRVGIFGALGAGFEQCYSENPLMAAAARKAALIAQQEAANAFLSQKSPTDPPFHQPGLLPPPRVADPLSVVKEADFTIIDDEEP